MKREFRQALGRNRGLVTQNSGARALEAVRASCTWRGISIFGRARGNRPAAIADAKGSSEIPIVTLEHPEKRLAEGRASHRTARSFWSEHRCQRASG